MHAIDYNDYKATTDKGTIQADCDYIAEERGDYHCGLDMPIRFNNITLGSRDDAMTWIEEHDRGFYDNLAVKYKDGEGEWWLVKIEYHC